MQIEGIRRYANRGMQIEGIRRYTNRGMQIEVQKSKVCRGRKSKVFGGIQIEGKGSKGKRIEIGKAKDVLL